MLIIDGDTMAYRACEDRWRLKAKNHYGFAVISLDDDGKRIPLDFTNNEDQEYLEVAFNKLKKNLEELLDKYWTNDYLMAIKSSTNFRDDLFVDYKANRKKNTNDLQRKRMANLLMRLLIDEGIGIEAVGREPDDMVRIWAHEAHKAKQDYTIVSVDKDLLCIPGRHYLLHKEKEVIVSKEQAVRHYYEQILKGDPTDNIAGCQGIGEIKARDILTECKTHEEFQYAIVETYFATYGEESWLHMLTVYGRLIHIQKHLDDYFDPTRWSIVKELI